MDAKGAERRTAPDADGEVVWSRRPDAGAKFANRCFGIRAGDGGKKARLTEESTK